MIGSCGILLIGILAVLSVSEVRVRGCCSGSTNFGIGPLQHVFGQLETSVRHPEVAARLRGLEGCGPGPSPFEARAKWRERLR